MQTYKGQHTSANQIELNMLCIHQPHMSKMWSYKSTLHWKIIFQCIGFIKVTEVLITGCSVRTINFSFIALHYCDLISNFYYFFSLFSSIIVEIPDSFGTFPAFWLGLSMLLTLQVNNPSA